MEHLRLLFYILSLATGFAGITVTAILWVRIRDRILLLMMVIIGLFSLGLVLYAVIYYLEEIIIYPVDLSTFSAYANFVIVMVLYACICVCVRWVSPDRSIVMLVMSAAPVFAAYVVFGLMGPRVDILSQWMQRRR